MKFTFSLLFFLLSTFSVNAKEYYGNLLVERLVKVYDGDTFTVDISNVHPIIGKAISVRVRGIDTPEMTDKDPLIKERALKAKLVTTELLSYANKIELVNVQRDKYFRLLADVYIDGMNLAEILVMMGLAVAYDGGTKPLWQKVLVD